MRTLSPICVVVCVALAVVIHGASSPGQSAPGLPSTCNSNSTLGDQAFLKQQSLLGCSQAVVYSIQSAAGNASEPSLCAQVQLVNNQQTPVYGWQLVYRFSNATVYTASAVGGAAELVTSGMGAPVRVVNSFQQSNINGSGGVAAFQLTTAADASVPSWQSTSADWTAVFLNGAYCSKLPSGSFQLPDCDLPVNGLISAASNGSAGASLPSSLCFSIFCCGTGYQTLPDYSPLPPTGSGSSSGAAGAGTAGTAAGGSGTDGGAGNSTAGSTLGSFSEGGSSLTSGSSDYSSGISGGATTPPSVAASTNPSSNTTSTPLPAGGTTAASPNGTDPAIAAVGDAPPTTAAAALPGNPEDVRSGLTPSGTTLNGQAAPGGATNQTAQPGSLAQTILGTLNNFVGGGGGGGNGTAYGGPAADLESSAAAIAAAASAALRPFTGLVNRTLPGFLPPPVSGPAAVNGGSSTAVNSTADSSMPNGTASGSGAGGGAVTAYGTGVSAPINTTQDPALAASPPVAAATPPASLIPPEAAPPASRTTMTPAEAATAALLNGNGGQQTATPVNASAAAAGGGGAGGGAGGLLSGGSADPTASTRESGGGGGSKMSIGLIVGVTVGAVAVVVATVAFMAYRTSRMHGRLLQQMGGRDSPSAPQMTSPAHRDAPLVLAAATAAADDGQAGSESSLVPHLSNASSLASRAPLMGGAGTPTAAAPRRVSRNGAGVGAGSPAAARSLGNGHSLLATTLSGAALRSLGGGQLLMLPGEDEEEEEEGEEHGSLRGRAADPLQGVPLSTLLRANSLAAAAIHATSGTATATAAASAAAAAAATLQLPASQRSRSSVAAESESASGIEAAATTTTSGGLGSRLLRGLSWLPQLFDGAATPAAAEALEEGAGVSSQSTPSGAMLAASPLDGHADGWEEPHNTVLLGILSDSAAHMSGRQQPQQQQSQRSSGGGLTGGRTRSGPRSSGTALLTHTSSGGRQSSSVMSTLSVAAGPTSSLLQTQAWLTIDFATEIVLDRKLGQGAFGSVYAADWRGQRVAVKLVPLMCDSDTYAPKSVESIKQEIQVLSRLSHPHIIQFYGACLAPPHVCIVEELAVGGSLASRLHGRAQRGAKASPLSYREVLQVGIDISSAMAYLHPGVVHRDLKPANVLLDGQGRALVCDFGIAKFKGRTFLSTKNVHAGTPAYMAPEQFEGRPVDEKVDQFAFAIILNECMTGQQPWEDLQHPMQIIFAVGVQCQRPALPMDCPPAMARLVAACWSEEPTERPAFTEILLTLQEEMARCNRPPPVLQRSLSACCSMQVAPDGATTTSQPAVATARRCGSAVLLHGGQVAADSRDATVGPPSCFTPALPPGEPAAAGCGGSGAPPAPRPGMGSPTAQDGSGLAAPAFLSTSQRQRDEAEGVMELEGGDQHRTGVALAPGAVWGAIGRKVTRSVSDAAVTVAPAAPGGVKLGERLAAANGRVAERQTTM